jgi:hypothetical protein
MLYAFSHREYCSGKERYGTYEHSIGDSNIGYLSTQGIGESRYTVGRIEALLEVHQDRNRPSRIVLLVQRYKSPPDTMWTYLRDRLMSHNALGIRVIGNEVGFIADVVPFEDVVGHVAVLPVEPLMTGMPLTIQLSKVRSTNTT